MNLQGTATFDHLDLPASSAGNAAPIYDDASFAAHCKAFVVGVAISVIAGVVAMAITGLPT